MLFRSGAGHNIPVSRSDLIIGFHRAVGSVEENRQIDNYEFRLNSILISSNHATASNSPYPDLFE